MVSLFFFPFLLLFLYISISRAPNVALFRKYALILPYLGFRTTGPFAELLAVLVYFDTGVPVVGSLVGLANFCTY
ncbi:hypothetical protein DFH07DRAFT_384672 [Mycena maculata]|uniref:Uncharacterized protein n=1 Tax=Mycena maculata TaxID=230809 RepID=A0AAD7JFU2_9AGAR|nr:hypothetical protein DFH07DRAFT_384672 [Mycena maculata]